MSFTDVLDSAITLATLATFKYANQLVDLCALVISTHFEVRSECLVIKAGEITLRYDNFNHLRANKEDITKLTQHLKTVIERGELEKLNGFLVFSNVPEERRQNVRKKKKKKILQNQNIKIYTSKEEDLPKR